MCVPVRDREYVRFVDIVSKPYNTVKRFISFKNLGKQELMNLTELDVETDSIKMFLLCD